MMPFGRLARTAGAAALVAMIGASVVPSYAGPAEVALLKSYEGSWRGTGKVVGTDEENVSCRMSLTPGNQDKVNYSGRCSLAGTNLSISGTLAYIEASGRFEGAMTSNLNFSGVAIGRRNGNGITFNLQSRGEAENAQLEINAAITLIPNGITVNFKATDVKTGKQLNATVPFNRA